MIMKILETTKYEGVDIVLHGGARYLTQRSIEVVADGGHFIDLGKPSEMEKLQSTYYTSTKSNIAVSVVGTCTHLTTPRNLYFYFILLFYLNLY